MENLSCALRLLAEDLRIKIIFLNWHRDSIRRLPVLWWLDWEFCVLSRKSRLKFWSGWIEHLLDLFANSRSIKRGMFLLLDLQKNFHFIHNLCIICEGHILFRLSVLVQMKLLSIDALLKEKMLLIVLLWFSLLYFSIALKIHSPRLWCWI